MNALKNLVGGVIGGAIGCYVFVWFFQHNFYAMIAPGGLLGIGASMFRHRFFPLPFITGIAAFVLGLFVEWKFCPWKDPSLTYFLNNLSAMSPVTWLMIGLGTILGFYFPFAQYRRAVLPGD